MFKYVVWKFDLNVEFIDVFLVNLNKFYFYVFFFFSVIVIFGNGLMIVVVDGVNI